MGREIVLKGHTHKMSVTKKDLISAVARRTGLTSVDVSIIIEEFMEAVSHALIDGRRIEIRGFARFMVKSQLSRMARNPKTGISVQVPAKLKPKFYASRELINRVNA
jgi:integration host factor subunit beta